MSRRKREWLKWKRFRVVCGCVEPPVVVTKYDAEADPKRRAELVALHDSPAVFEQLHVLRVVDNIDKNNVWLPPKRAEQELHDGRTYEGEYDKDTMNHRERMAIIKAAQRANPDGFLNRKISVDDYQGSRRKPLQWRCPRCHRNVSPTAKQADTIAHEYLNHGVSQVDLIVLARTLGDQ